MSILGGLRQSARALLPGDCFLRRDQQLRALFVTDFPRRHPDIKESTLQSLCSNGFAAAEENGLWLLDLKEEARLAFILSLPAPAVKNGCPLEIRSLCRSLLSRGAVPAQMQQWEPIKRTLLRLDSGQEALLLSELRALCAQYKRQSAPLPTAIVSLLTKEDASC